MLTSYSLFKIINDSFDNILNVHEKRKRGVIYNFIKFLGMTIFGSLLILLLLSATSISIVSKFFDVSFLQNLLLYVTPFVILFIIFSLGFAFIPTIRIKSNSVFIGSAVASIVWIIFKSIFNWYISTLTNTEIIFGYFASIPIFFFWIYANWIIMLCGVIIVSILEGKHNLGEIKQNTNTMKITIEQTVNGKNFGSFSKINFSKTDLKKIIKEIVEEEKNSP